MVLGTPPENKEIDHKNRNIFDNKKENLRFATSSQNKANRIVRPGISGYRGVTFSKSSNKWRAKIKVEYRIIDLGCHTIKEDAARAYNVAAIQYFGEFAVINEDIQ